MSARLNTRRGVLVFWLFVQALAVGLAEEVEGVVYTNFTRPGPIEIHLLRIPRAHRALEIQSIHSGGKAIGRSTVSEQLKWVAGGKPIAAINGDFFQLGGAFAGDPRGLQIVNGALISAPANSASFWIDAAGAPHLGVTRSALLLTWPDGSTTPIGLNEKCDANEVDLYTPDLDVSLRENPGRELVLSPPQNETNATFRANAEYSLKVEEIRDTKEARIPPGKFLLALGSSAVKSAPVVQPGTVVKISTKTTPSMHGVKTAINGGPILVKSGMQQRFDKASSEAFQHRHMVEKHPRTALGWNASEYVWVEIDGRQKNSVGMTLNELGALMVEFGCIDAMNLDGGGSSTIWFDGKVRNRPSDGSERPVANALALVRKAVPASAHEK